MNKIEREELAVRNFELQARLVHTLELQSKIEKMTNRMNAKALKHLAFIEEVDLDEAINYLEARS